MTLTNFWMSIPKVIMTIKYGLYPFFLIDMKVTAKIPWQQLYLHGISVLMGIYSAKLNARDFHN
jgi:hypothetical protein